MKGKTVSYKPRVIKRLDQNGKLVDYGLLEVGIIAGYRCLANKETLLLLGAGLAKQKVPENFHDSEFVEAHVTGKRLRVYVVKAADLTNLVNRISLRERVTTAQVINSLHDSPMSTWMDGVRLDAFEPSVKETVLRKEEIKESKGNRVINFLSRLLSFSPFSH